MGKALTTCSIFFSKKPAWTESSPISRIRLSLFFKKRGIGECRFNRRPDVPFFPIKPAGAVPERKTVAPRGIFRRGIKKYRTRVRPQILGMNTEKGIQDSSHTSAALPTDAIGISQKFEEPSNRTGIDHGNRIIVPVVDVRDDEPFLLFI